MRPNSSADRLGRVGIPNRGAPTRALRARARGNGKRLPQYGHREARSAPGALVTASAFLAFNMFRRHIHCEVTGFR